MKKIISFFNLKITKICILIILLSVFSFFLITNAKKDAITSDEPVHIAAGYLKTFGEFRFNFEHPPLINYLTGWSIRLFAHPNKAIHDPGEQYAYGDDFLFLSGNDAQEILFAGRLPIIVFSILLALLIFYWARSLWGYWGGMIAMLLVVFCPTLLAHGKLATTDMGSTFFLVLSMWGLYWLSQKFTFKKILIFSLIIGLTIASKYSCVIIIPIIGLIFLIFLILKKITIKQFFGYLLMIGTISTIILWLCYFISMYETFSWNPDPYTLHVLFHGKNLNHWYSQLLVMPFDYYMRGYMFVKDHAELGHMSFLDGQMRIEGWWYYFPLAIWYKTLIPTLILFILSILAMFKIRSKNFSDELLIFILPVVYLLFSMTTKLNIGLRHMMLVYPFMYITIGRLALVKFKNKTLNFLYLFILFGLLVWVAVESSFFYNSSIAYFNQIVGGPQNGYRHLSDSNVDWGQDLSRVDEYMKKKEYNYTMLTCDETPRYDYYHVNHTKMGEEIDPSVNYIAIRDWCYQLPSDDKDDIYQQIKNSKSIDNIGYSILIFKIK